MAKEMEVEQAFNKGSIRTKIYLHDGEACLHLWAVDEAGRDSPVILITDSADCHNLADSLRDYANELDELNGIPL